MKKEFYTLAYFEIAADALLIKAKLESEGIPAFVREENRNYSGVLTDGISLQVYLDDKAEAKAIYNEVRAYATDNHGNPIRCPNCKAEKSETYFAKKGLLYRLFPFLEKPKYKCQACGMITSP